MGFPIGSVDKESAYNAGNAGDMGLISGSGRSPAAESGNTVQYSCLENSMDRGAWWTTVHGAQSWTWPTHWAQSLYPDLVCRNVLSTKYSEGASSYAEHSGPLSLINESNKKLKYRLGSWEIPSKEVTFTTKPEGWMPDSHCSVFLWLWKSQGFVCQPQSCIEDALLPASSRCVTAGGADPEVTCWVLL